MALGNPRTKGHQRWEYQRRSSNGNWRIYSNHVWWHQRATRNTRPQQGFQVWRCRTITRHWLPRGARGTSGCSVKKIPSGNLLHSYGKWPFLMGKSTINNHFPYVSYYQRVHLQTSRWNEKNKAPGGWKMLKTPSGFTPSVTTFLLQTSTRWKL